MTLISTAAAAAAGLVRVLTATLNSPHNFPSVACRAVLDQISRFLRDHDCRRVRVAADYGRHDRCIHHAQAFNAMNAQL